jgi:hypothetical protein
MANKGVGVGTCLQHGEFFMDAQDSPCPSCGEQSMKEWTVQISFYSMAKNEVGNPADKEPIRRVYTDPILALLDLDKSIDSDEYEHQEIGCRKLIVSPEGREMAFDGAYTEIFKVAPVFHDNKLNTYPELKKAARKIKS